MSPAELRAAVKAAHDQAGADADAILEASDLAESYCTVAIHLLAQGDHVISAELLFRAGQIDPHFASIHAEFFGGES